MTVTSCDWQQGFPANLKAPVPSSSSLSLSGVGMRRKNLYIMEVDVYLAALNLSPEALLISQKIFASDPNASIAEAIMTPVNGSGCKAAVTLRFVRDVAKDKIVEAFNDAFNELNQNDVKTFKTALGNTLGDAGLKKGEEIAFFWTSDGIVITKNNNVGNKFKSASGDAVERRLLEVYVDPRRAVSPELIKSIKEQLIAI